MALLRPAGQTARSGVSPVRLLLLAVVIVRLSATSALAQPVADEDHVKAAYLLSFAKFVEWPPHDLPLSSPLEIAIVGGDSLGGALEEVLQGKSANGHPIQLRHLQWNDVLTKYQIVFISASEEVHLSEILRGLGHDSVLTVSDIDRFSLRGGVIEFRMVGNRMRFDINRASALAAQLNISSKLFNVARAVHEGSATQ